MIVIHLNDSTYGAWNIDDPKLLLVVTNYEIGDYCGSGDALLYRDGMIEYYNLGHCSCYGPFENGPEFVIGLDNFRDQNEVASCYWDAKLGDAFLKELELLLISSVG